MLQTPKAVDPALTDAEERQRSEAQGPYPQPLAIAKNPRQFAVTRMELAAGQANTVTAAFEPEEWIVYVRFGRDADGFYVAPGGDGSQSLWQRADKPITVPGRGTQLAVQSDAAITMVVYVIAASNVEVSV